MGELADRLGAVPLEGFTVGCSGRRATLRYPLGVSVSRSALDAALAAEAQGQGVEFLAETTAALLPDDQGEGRALRLRRHGVSWTVRARFVVSATGLADGLRDGKGAGWVSSRSRIGAGVIAPTVPAGYGPRQIFMACGKAGYVGLVVLEDGQLDLAAALCPMAVRQAGGIGSLAELVLEEAGLPVVPGVADLPWKGTPALTRNASDVAEGSVFRVGDAAGYVEPFTGEGIGWALDGGRTLGNLLSEALRRRIPEPERAWRRAHRREIARTQLACRAVRLALRNPWMTRAMVGILDAWPGLARPVLHSLHRARNGPAASASSCSARELRPEGLHP